MIIRNFIFQRKGIYMKKIFTAAIILLCSFSAAAETEDAVFNKISKEISGLRSKLKKGTVAVIPFEAVGFTDSAYGTYAADKLSAAISRENKLTLVEREKLSGILQEKELSMIGIVEEDEAKKIGALLSVDAIISGRVYRTEKGADITIRVINARSGILISVISRNYDYASKISGIKKDPWFSGTWEVTETAPYLLERDMRYEKLVLRNDKSFSLFLINNDGRSVEIRGYFKIKDNNIDYDPQQILSDGRSTQFKRIGTKPQGTIYLDKGKLFFNYTSMGGGERVRLDAMNKEFRNVAERGD